MRISALVAAIAATLAGERLKKLVSAPPSSDTNTVLVAHIFNTQKSFDLTPEEGRSDRVPA